MYMQAPVQTVVESVVESDLVKAAETIAQGLGFKNQNLWDQETRAALVVAYRKHYKLTPVADPEAYLADWAVMAAALQPRPAWAR